MTSSDDVAPHPGYPMFLALHFEETFLRNATISFSPGLNVIFGLNGSGKTLTVETIRCAVLGHLDESNASRRSLVENNLAGGRARVDVSTEHRARYSASFDGKKTTVTNERGDVVDVSLDGELFRASFYSQTDIHAIAEDWRRQLALIDSFEAFGTSKIEADIEETLRLLRDNESALVKLEKELLMHHEELIELPVTIDKLKALRPAGGENAEAMAQALAERANRSDELAFLESSLSSTETLLAETRAFAILVTRRTAIAPPVELLAGKNASFIDAVVKEAAGVQSGCTAASDSIAAALEAWALRLRRAKVELSTIHAAQETTFIELAKTHDEDRKIMGERSRLEERRVELQARQLLQDERTLAAEALRIRRDELLDRLEHRWVARTAAREAACRFITERLDGRVRATIAGRADRDAFRKLLFSIVKNRTLREKLLTLVVDRIDPLQLARLVHADDVEPIIALEGDAPNRVKRATELLAILRESDRLYELETLEVSDVPAIELNDYDRWANVRDVSHGQRASCLLPVILISSRCPLIMDQPEDHVDPFNLGRLLVAAIRVAKPQRQLIIVTLASVLPLLAQAEMTIRLGCVAGRSGVMETGPARALAGSIEHDMDAGAEVFQARARAYGYVISNEKQNPQP